MHTNFSFDDTLTKINWLTEQLTLSSSKQICMGFKVFKAVKMSSRFWEVIFF